MVGGAPQDDRGRKGAVGLTHRLPGHLSLRGGALTARGLTRIDLRAALRAEVDQRRLFAWLPVCLGLGVALFFAAEGVPGSAVPLALFLGLALSASLLRAHLAACLVLIGSATVFLGFAAASLRTERATAPILDQPVFARLSGFVETVDAGPQRGRFVLVVTQFETRVARTAPSKIRMTFQGPAPRAGSHITGQARLMPPPQPAFPGGYDFARDAYFLGLGAVGRWVGPIQLSAPTADPGALLRVTAWIDNARVDMTNRITTVIGGQAGALSAAMVTGKRGLISEAVNDDLRGAGVYHIVSISGLHMVLAAGVFFALARLILVAIPGVANRYSTKKWAAVVAMVGATAYCVFSGSEVATERSLIMVLVMLGAILLDRPAISMRNLAISAIIVLLREPETMLGPSFQMSFAAVAGMIAAHTVWLNWRQRRRDHSETPQLAPSWMQKAALAIGASLATTLIAGFATAPFGAYHFQRLNPYSLIGNALAIPFVSFLVMPAAVAGTVLMPLGLDAPIWWLMGLGSQKVLEVSHLVAGIDGAVRGLRAFDLTALILMSGGFIVLVLLGSALRLIGLIPLVAGIVLAARAPEVDVLVDRQGQSAAVRGMDGSLHLLARGAARFTVERWLASDGDLRRAGEPSLKQGIFCDRMGCTTRLMDGRSIALILDASAFEEDCARAAVIITPLVAPALCRAAPLVLDRKRLEEGGSLALYRKGEDLRLVESRPSTTWKPWFGRPAPAKTVAVGLPAEPVRVAPEALSATDIATPVTPDDGAEVMLP